MVEKQQKIKQHNPAEDVEGNMELPDSHPQNLKNIMKEYGETKMDQGFNLIKSARMGNAIPNKFNVPSQGNHQTPGVMQTGATPMQTTTPAYGPTGGYGSQMTKVQTNQNDRFSQSTTRQVKSSYGVGVGPGSGNMAYNKVGVDTNPYGTRDPDRGALKGPMNTGVGKIFSAIGKGLKSAFGDNSSPYKKGGNTEVACSGKKKDMKLLQEK
jgi:hypothetical protein